MIGSSKGSFFKFSGAGNTFVVFDNKFFFEQLCLTFSCSPQDIFRWACDPVMGVCADGGFLLKRKSEGLWSWDFYNSDGSEAEMCGNAARCAIAAIQKLEPNAQGQVMLETSAGLMSGHRDKDGLYSIEMMVPQWEKKQMHVEGIHFDLLDTGVPHAVYEGPALLKEKSRHLRSHSDFGHRGANITSYEVLSDLRIKAVSYERGVEDFTKACGTGAVAAALCYADKYSKIESDPVVSVEMPGGDLEIYLQRGKRPIMRGPAVLVGEVHLSWESVASFFKSQK